VSALLAGAARASIAPRRDDLRAGVYLGGFGAYRARRATGVHDEPQCRVIALGDGVSTLIVAAVDLVGAGGPLLDRIRRDAARLTGVRPEAIVVACTHSHASPDTQGLWGGVPAAYEEHVAHRAASAIWEAWQNMAPANARVATALLGGVVRNRRGWPETDETLTTMRLDAASGQPVATLVNYACHPTASGPANVEVSRDWCGVAVDEVERAGGGVAVYVNGAIGDVNPARDGAMEHARALGEAVAAAALASLDSATGAGGRLRVDVRPHEVALNFERLSEGVQAAIGRAGFALSALAKSGGLGAAALALHAAGRPDLAQIVAALRMMSERRLVHRDGRTYVPAHAGVIALGDDFEALCAPGEVLTRLALPLRASMGSRHRMFFGLAHDTLGYFIPEDEWMTGRNNNYEESVSPGRHAGAELADALLQLVPHHGVRP